MVRNLDSRLSSRHRSVQWIIDKEQSAKEMDRIIKQHTFLWNSKHEV